VRRLVGIAMVGMLVAACGGTPIGSEGDRTTGPDGGEPTLAGGGGGGGGGGRPSSAKVRIVNVYNAGAGRPDTIDVYAEPWVEAGARPLTTVAYGTATDFFDPTVADEQGDMFLTFYRHGETGNGNQLITQTETLTGSEVITFVLSSSAELAADGSPKLLLQALFHGSTSGFFDPTPAPGEGVLLVNMHGIDGIVQPPEGTTWYLSTGQGCTKALGNDEYTLSAAGPGDGAQYPFDPGGVTVSLHPSAPDAFPDCSTPPLISGVTASIAAGQTTLVVVFAPTPTEVRSMVLSLAK
jgi:hypothetical protein